MNPGKPGIGIWSRTGEFLGVAEIPGSSGAEGAPDGTHLSTSRTLGEEGRTFTAHRFSEGYRVRVEERWKGGEEVLWLAPVEEGEESYMGLFSEEELDEVFPHLAAAFSGVRWAGRG